MNEWQSTVLEALLDGDDPDLAVLRDQLAACSVRDFEESEFGFLLDLWVEDSATALDVHDRFSIDDVFGEFEGLEGEVCFLLHVVRGRLKTLEGYVSEPHWPVGSSLSLSRWWYVVPDDAQGGQFMPSKTRDLVFALRGLDGLGDA